LALDIKRYLSWSNIEDGLQSIQYKLGDYKPDIIAGVARGGAVPAVILSHILEVPCEIFTWQTRDGGVKEYRYDIIDSIVEGNNRNVLLLDDINDTGLTFNQIIENWKYYNPQLIDNHVRTACLIERVESKFTVDFPGVREYNSDWIVFPWERN